MWLYVPGTSSPCARGSEDLNSASSSLSTIGERLAEASATWRGKEQQPQAWSRRWKQGGFIRLLSGLTCSPSTLDHGVAQFISSLREIPVRTTALPAKAQAKTESASSLPKSAALPKSAGLILSSARTCRGTQTGSSKLSSRHWKGWATALRQEYSVRPRPATPCGASDCSSWRAESADQPSQNAPALGQPQWPSAMAGTAGTESYNAAGNSDFSRQAMQLADAMLTWAAPRTSDTNGPGAHGDGGIDLRTQASQWEGPSVAVTGGGRFVPPIGGVMPTAATPQPQAYTKVWACPMTADDGHKVTIASHQNSLIKMAHDFCSRPPSSPAQPIAGGSMSSTDSPNSNQPSVKRRLNPIFVEALMRWPTGLSGFERQETAWTRWWLLMPSFLSQLCSASEGEMQMDLFGAAA